MWCAADSGQLIKMRSHMSNRVTNKTVCLLKCIKFLACSELEMRRISDGVYVVRELGVVITRGLWGYF